MRIEPPQRPVPPAQSAGVAGIPQPSYDTLLISPEAPTWPHAIAQLFQRLWSWIISLLGKKTAAPPKEEFRPAPDVAQVIRQYQVAQKAKPRNPIKVTLGQAVLPAAFSWWQKDLYPLSAFVSNKTLSASAEALQRCASYVFPNTSPQFIKGTSLAIVAPIIWHAADYLGYPQGKLFAIVTAVQIIGTLFQAHVTAQQQQFQRIQARMA